uniref:site-specific DNA-methyltransferase (cytosine-N(4)-specific) n=1 Tax=viral metagenome TaxID=1070528 RepID=A0A6M3LM77_9ZZZZ
MTTVYEFHEVASIFPLMMGEPFQELVDAIRRDGQQVPIFLHTDGRIIDGRNRYRACVELGIEPKVTRYTGMGGTQALVDFVVNLNIQRRHLDASSRAAAAAKADAVLDKERQDAKARQLATLPGPGEQGFHARQIIATHDNGRALDEVAKRFRTNREYIRKAIKLREEAPETFEAVATGKKTFALLDREALKAKQQAKRVAALTSDGPMPQLYEGKAEALDFIADESVDLIITSPPYNLGDEGWPMGGGGRTPRDAGIGYSDVQSEAVYQEWQIAVLHELYRVATPGASFFYNHKVRQRGGAVIHPLDWLRHDCEGPCWTLRQEIIWDRESTHNHSPALFWPIDERIYWLTKGKPTLPDHPIGHPSIWRFTGPTLGRWHPAPFSDRLPEIVLEALGRPGITVLDPFGGGMTTCAIARKHGYLSIGVDIDSTYVSQAAEEYGWTKTNGN